MNDSSFIEEIVDEVVETRTFIEKLELWFELTNDLKKFFRMTDRIDQERILKRVKEDFPYVEVKK